MCVSTRRRKHCPRSSPVQYFRKQVLRRRLLHVRRGSSALVLGVLLAFAPAAESQATGSSPAAPQAAVPSAPQSSSSLPASTASSPAVLITLNQAIHLALAHNQALQAERTLISQGKAEEITANLRPNPILGLDSQYVPLFSPQDFSQKDLDETQEFDLGIAYLFERGHKRQRRLRAAQDQTAVTSAEVADAGRSLTFQVAQQFIAALLDESTLQFSLDNLKSFGQTVSIVRDKFKAGAISEGDYLKIKLQLLQFETDASSARLARAEDLIALRQLLGYNSVPENYDVAGHLEYVPLHAGLEDLQAEALRDRPDLRAATLGINAAESQVQLAKANGKQDVTAQFNYVHVNAQNDATISASIPWAIFNRNQGEIARTRFALTQAEEMKLWTSNAVLSDVADAYRAVKSNASVVKLYNSGYLTEARESRDISQYAFKRGAASLLDFLDAERSYRSVQLSYRQVLSSYMTALEQLKEAVGTRTLP